MLGNTEQVVATSDATVIDPVSGARRKVFAGQVVPPELVKAYKAQGGDTAKQGDQHPPGALIAAKDCIVRDEANGIRRKIIAGQPVPADLVDAYKQEIGDNEDDEAPTGDEITPGLKVADYEAGTPEQIAVLLGAAPLDMAAAALAYEQEHEARPDVVRAAELRIKALAYEDMTKADLEKEIERRRALNRRLEIEGTGTGGNVLVADLRTALRADDAYEPDKYDDMDREALEAAVTVRELEAEGTDDNDLRKALRENDSA